MIIDYEYAIEGRFKNVGQTIYTDRIDYRNHCIYHYNQTPEELVPDCINNSEPVFLGEIFKHGLVAVRILDTLSLANSLSITMKTVF